MKDGGEISLDWLEENNMSPDTPIVILLPGLTGHSQSEYIKSFVNAARASGARCVVFNNRGRGGVALKVLI